MADQAQPGIAQVPVMLVVTTDTPTRTILDEEFQRRATHPAAKRVAVVIWGDFGRGGLCQEMNARFETVEAKLDHLDGDVSALTSHVFGAGRG